MLNSDQILDILLAGNPVSIVRAGDGEGICLNATAGYAEFNKASNAVIKRQIGYSPTVDEVEQIRLNLIETYNNCDITGVPNHKQKTTSDWNKVVDILRRNCPGNNGIFCDIDIAYQWLETENYNKLLQNRHVLNYISCRDLDEGFKNKWNIEIVNKYQIAPEAKFTSGYEGDRHYPTQFNRAQRWMDVQLNNFPGTLLLVGAGVIGKIYCNWWRDRGGLAFDIGGAMDCFAGRVTRGPEKGLDKEDLTYKL